MAENVENQEVNEEVVAPIENAQESVKAQTEYSDVEKRAMAQGWVPEDQYEGTGKWRPAEEFLDRGELFSKIDDLHRRNRSLESTVQEVKKHYKKIAENEYKRALTELRAAKAVALDQGDSHRVVEIDEAIETTKAEQTEELKRIDTQPAQQPVTDPVFVVWQNRNPWYAQDVAMKIYADTVGEELVKRGMTNPVEVLTEIERRVKKEFVHKFNNPNRDKPGAVEGGGSKGTGRKDTFQLSAEETQVMNKFVRAGVMTKEEYIKEIKESRGA